MTTPRSSMVAVLGGTFDPVHLGHLHAAQCVRRAFRPARVVLMPCALAPHKHRPRLTAAQHRIAMLRLAAAGKGWLVVSTAELDRGGVSYTIDTLRALERDLSPLMPVFVLGMDSLFEIHTWRSWTELLGEFDLIAVDRPGRVLQRDRSELRSEVASRLVTVRFADGALDDLAGPPPGSGGRVFHLAIPPMDVSSSRVRSAVAAGTSLAGLVPAAVGQYIESQNLYRGEERR
jgi:nicotinate-nucleotide adenylyltransferase